MNVFDVLSKHVNWATQRYSVAAANIANLDTPGFRAMEVEPFQLEVNATAMRISLTHQGHINAQGTSSAQSHEVFQQNRADETHSANNVSAENEMRIIGEAARSVSANTSLMKLFHRMTISAAKG
jgi:flagellar basal-body rod protein FlgB